MSVREMPESFAGMRVFTPPPLPSPQLEMPMPLPYFSMFGWFVP